MTTLAIDVGTLLTSSPQIRNGQQRIAGTGVTVQRVVRWYKLGLNPDEIADRIGHLALAQVHAALAYYYTNRQQLDADMDQEERAADSLEEEYLASMRRRSAA